MTARDRLHMPDRSPTPGRLPALDLPTEIIPAAPDSSAPPDRFAPDRFASTAALDTAEDGEGGDEDGKFSLSITQIMASTAAAVTAALIGSQLGVAGTLVGAALASIVSGVGAAIYSHSLLVTRRQMRRALELVRPADQAAPTAAVAAVAGAPSTARPTRFTVADDDLTVLMPLASPPIVRPPRTHGRTPGRRRTVAAVLAGVAAAGVIFAGALATVTLVEAVKGAPLSGGDSGLSVLGGTGSSGTSTDPATVTVTSRPPSSEPASTTVTQTVTQSPTASSQPAEQSTAPTTAPTTAPNSGAASSPAAAASSAAAGSAAVQAATTAP